MQSKWGETSDQKNKLTHIQWNQQKIQQQNNRKAITKYFQTIVKNNLGKKITFYAFEKYVKIRNKILSTELRVGIHFKDNSLLILIIILYYD